MVKNLKKWLKKLPDFLMLLSMVIWQLAFPIMAAQPVYAVRPVEEDHKILICHSTQPNPSQGGGAGPQDNPYNDIEVDQNAADGVAGNQQGNQPDHFGEHNGPLFVPGTNQNYWGDIIPPIEGVHNGLNWTTEGQIIWNNDCEVEEPEEPEPISLTVVKEVTDGSDTNQEFPFTVTDQVGFSLSHSEDKEFEDLDEGAYSITEDLSNLTDWELDDVDCGEHPFVQNGNSVNVTLSEGDDVTCTFKNDESQVVPGSGSIQVEKQVDEGEGFVTVGAESDFKWGLDDGPNNRDMGAPPEDLAVGDHDVDENIEDVDGYDFVGWFEGDGNCEDAQNPNTLPATVEVEEGETTVVTLCNEAEDEGKVELCHATGSEDNSFVLITISPAGAFHGHLDDGSGGIHGDHQNGEDVIPPFTYKDVEYSQNWDAQGQAFFRAGCQEPDVEDENIELFIEKLNDKPSPTVTGDIVTYTLIITLPDTSDPSFNTCVTDLPPENFNYIPGSWSATSAAPFNDAETIGALNENVGNSDDNCGTPGGPKGPDYASPGQWFLGTMQPGQVIYLTYKTVINNLVSPGIYPDVAFVLGHSSTNNEVLGKSVEDETTPFVDTQVTVVEPEDSGGAVLGASVLPNTASPFGWLTAFLPALAFGTGYFVFEKRRATRREGSR